MKNQLRTFIAVSLSSTVLAEIKKIVRTFQTHFWNVRWVEPKNMHVTLKFLGDTPLNDLPQLILTVTQCTSEMGSFDLTFRGLGAFPNRESPKTVWIGCQEGSKELIQLAESIDSDLLPLGFPREPRRFSPHLTIGRIKKSVQESPLMSLAGEEQDRLFGSCSVSEVQIFSSELTRHGAIYDELAAIPLRN